MLTFSSFSLNFILYLWSIYKYNDEDRCGCLHYCDDDDDDDDGAA